MIDLLWGIAIGIATNLLSWWILFHLIVPNLRFSQDISKTTTAKIKDDKSGYKYRVKIENSGKRTIIDVELLARLRIKGISKYKTNWHIINIPLSSEGKGYKIPRLLPIKKKLARRHTIRLLINNVNEFKTSLSYPKDFREKAKKEILCLEDLLELGSKASLQIVAFGYDEFSGTKKLFIGEYNRDSIKEGRFDTKGLNIKQLTTNSEVEDIEDESELDE